MATILAVDDDMEIVGFLGDAFHSQGHTFLTAGESAEALRLADEQRPDLVLLDVELPGMDGYELCRRFQSIPGMESVPVLFMSVRGEAEDRLRGLELGAIDYLPKPFSIAELLAKVKTQLALKLSKDAITKKSTQLAAEMRRRDALISSFYPQSVLEEIQQSNSVRPRRHRNVAVLIADIVGFTPFCQTNDPELVLANIRELSAKFQAVARQQGLEKVNFVGDSYMAAAGLFEPAANPVLSAIKCGFALGDAAATVPAKWKLRVGIDIGDVVSGVPGTERAFFGLYGNAVNTAARMQTFAQPGGVCVSAVAWQRVAGQCAGASLGEVQVKGKGLMEVFQVARVIED